MNKTLPTAPVTGDKSASPPTNKQPVLISISKIKKYCGIKDKSEVKVTEESAAEADSKPSMIKKVVDEPTTAQKNVTFEDNSLVEKKPVKPTL
jgi:hypothetical protein